VGPLPTSAEQLQQGGGTLYIRDSGRVRAVDPRSGRERWAYPAGSQGPANPEVVSFVAGVEATAVAARRTDGSGPEGLVVLLDAATGRPRWQRRVGGEVYPNSLAVGPAGIHLVAQDHLTFEQLAARLRRDDRSSLHPRLTTTSRGGRPLWQRPLRDRGGGTGLLGDALVTTVGGRVVVLEGRGWDVDLEAFDAATGARSWTRRVERAGGALAWRDRRPVVRAADGAQLRATSCPRSCWVPGRRCRRNGDVRPVRLVGTAHENAESDRPFSSSGVTARDGKMLVLARDRCLYVVDDRTGAVAGRQCGLQEPRPGSPLISTPEVTIYRTLDAMVAYPLRTG
jgi:outer membrane protein assembly factor BamB